VAKVNSITASQLMINSTVKQYIMRQITKAGVARPENRGERTEAEFVRANLRVRPGLSGRGWNPDPTENVDL